MWERAENPVSPPSARNEKWHALMNYSGIGTEQGHLESVGYLGVHLASASLRLTLHHFPLDKSSNMPSTIKQCQISHFLCSFFNLLLRLNEAQK